VKIVSLDVHAQTSQITVVDEDGEVLWECQVATDARQLRCLIGGIPGPKMVVFEEGPLSGMLHDALEGVAEKIVSSDPTHNALIARAEDSNDERDARRLAMLARAGALHEVYVAVEPYRTLRSLTQYDYGLARSVTREKNQIKGLCRRYGIRCGGGGVYRRARRDEVLQALPNAAIRWQMGSLYRRLDGAVLERARVQRVLSRQAAKLPIVERLQTIPGVGAITARCLVAWIADPHRFKTPGALSSYAGLGLGQGWTNWKPVGRAHASKRGQRRVKRVLFLAARCAIRGDNALARRYQARRDAGWRDDKAIRDIARKILFAAHALWRGDRAYDDTLVQVPAASPEPARGRRSDLRAGRRVPSRPTQGPDVPRPDRRDSSIAALAPEAHESD
jgi:transposase